MKKSRTVRPPAGVESPTTRRLPLVELLIDTEAELFDLAVRSGLQVLDAMLEEDRTAICGPRYAHQADRTASRAGTVASTVVLGGRKVSIRRPRVRSGRQEVPLPTFQTMAQTRSTAAAHRRATVGRREHTRLCPESGAAPGRHPQPQRE